MRYRFQDGRERLSAGTLDFADQRHIKRARRGRYQRLIDLYRILNAGGPHTLLSRNAFYHRAIALELTSSLVYGQHHDGRFQAASFC